MSKRVIVSVISDLVTDQRVHKVCLTLHEAGHEVLLIGSGTRKSLPLSPRAYRAGRIRMLFNKKIFRYAEFNIRLFFRLLFTRGDIFLGNDLDALPAVWLAGRLKGKPVVYDTHEYWMGMPELDGRRRVKKVWQRIEAFLFPRVRYIYTICDSFCELYRKDYGKTLRAVRNVPYKSLAGIGGPLPPEVENRLPRDKYFLLFQGAGINPERGVEELVMAMEYLDPERFHLVIIGAGDIFHRIEAMVTEQHLADRITVLPKVPFEVLRSLTRRADLGLSLDKPTNINHIYGLPNKIFDYLHSGVPVLVSRLVELEKIVNKYDVGAFIDNHQPAHIASRIEEMFRDPARIESWKKNTEKVRDELNWEKEGRIVVEIFEQVEQENS
ncbi:MAG TPA: glycosyltransferase [Puia sp.]|nr:glycosyltransferase [Puia sp.]